MKTEENKPAAPVPPPMPAMSAEQSAEKSAASQIAENQAKLAQAVQTASDQALSDSAIKTANANINPQARAKTFDMAAMDQYIVRKYYSDDLGLEISSQPFDAMFIQGNSYIPFVEIESDSWLDSHLNNLRRDANSRLAKLHQENIMIMRERYMLLVTKHCENVVKAVATDDPKTRFGFALKTITQTKDNEIAALSEHAEAYKRDREEDFQKRMKIEMDNAANVAKSAFINRYGKEHERELKDIEQDLRNNIESEFVAAKENLKNERRKEAKRQLDAGISETLKIIGDEYTKMLAMERKEYARLQAVITDFQNENMANEEARINTMAEDQRRNNEVVKTREEYEAKFALASRDFDARVAAVRTEIDKLMTEHENRIGDIRDRHDHDIQELKNAHEDQIQHKNREIDMLNEQLTSANTQLETLTKKYTELDANVNKKYINQIEMLKNEREAWTERANQVEHLHKYTDRIKITVMIIGIVAALGIGVILGTALKEGTSADEGPAPIINYIGEDLLNSKTTSSSESEIAEPEDAEDNDETTKPAETSGPIKTTKPSSTSAPAETMEPATTIKPASRS